MSVAPSAKSSAFVEAIVAFLLPYFTVAGTDLNHARIEVIETLASYATRTRAEMLQAAQIIALGMTTLDVLAEAKIAEMSPSMRLRFQGCANGLNRSIIQMEKALDRRLACDLPAPLEPGPEQDHAIPQAEREAETRQSQEIEKVQPVIDLHPNRFAGARGGTPEEPDNMLWAYAMMDTMKHSARPAPAG
jgi:hypothetical protein